VNPERAYRERTPKTPPIDIKSSFIL